MLGNGKVFNDQKSGPRAPGWERLNFWREGMATRLQCGHLNHKETTLEGKQSFSFVNKTLHFLNDLHLSKTCFIKPYYINHFIKAIKCSKVPGLCGKLTRC